jgi:SNF2 family DNA or RNA helicase
MNLYQEIKSSTEHQVWSRRLKYSKLHPDGNILSFEYLSNNNYCFVVQGSEEYEVGITDKSVICDCYYYEEEGKLCKHIAGCVEFLNSKTLDKAPKPKKELNAIDQLKTAMSRTQTLLLVPKVKKTVKSTSTDIVKWNLTKVTKLGYFDNPDNCRLELNAFKSPISKASSDPTEFIKLTGTALSASSLIKRALNGYCNYLSSEEADTINSKILCLNPYQSFQTPYISLSNLNTTFRLLQTQGLLYYDGTKIISYRQNSTVKLAFQTNLKNKDLFDVSIMLVEENGMMTVINKNYDILEFYFDLDNNSYLFIGDKRVGVVSHVLTSSIDLSGFGFLLETTNKTTITSDELNQLSKEYNILSPEIQLPEEMIPKDIILDNLIPRLILTDKEESKTPMLKVELDFHYPELGDNSLNTLITGNKSSIIYRSNPSLENKRRVQLNEILTDCGLDNISSVISYSTNDGITLVLDVLKRILDIGFEVIGQDSLKSYRYVAPTIDIRINSGIDWLEVDGGISFEGNVMTLPEIAKIVKSKNRFIKIGDKTGVLPEEWMSKHSELFALTEFDGEKMKVSKWHLNLVQDFLAVIETKDYNTAQLNTQLKKLKTIKAVKKLPTPSIKAELRPYQQVGYEWLNFIHKNKLGGILADDMGLGKTIQVIAFLNELYKTKAKKTLIIVPTSLLSNWQNELDKFAPSLNYGILYGNNRDSEEILSKDHQILITTYGTMLKDLELLKSIKWESVILDEAQQIKNPNSLTYKAVKLLNADSRVSMTGTPVENGLMDLWSQFSFLNPAMLGSVNFFNEHFVKDISQAQRDKLTAITSPFILRRVKEDVAKELGDKIENTIYIDFDPAQKQLYDATRTLFIQDMASEKKNKFQVLESLTKLRQICCHPQLIDENSIIPSPKLDVAFDKLQEVIAKGHKVLIFSQFTRMLRIFEERLKVAGIQYTYLDGKTQNRQHVVDQFQSKDTIQTFLISLKAGGVGLNLTSADYVFIMDPWWNPAAENQATDRTHRIGQDKTVFVYRFVIKDSLEEKILKLQESKKLLIKSIITTETSLLKELKLKDIGNLI